MPTPLRSLRELAEGFSRQLMTPFSISIGPDCTA